MFSETESREIEKEIARLKHIQEVITFKVIIILITIVLLLLIQ